VEEEGAVQRRHGLAVVRRFRDAPGALPFLAARLGQGLELGPGKGADVALALPVPAFLVDHFADGARKQARGAAVQGHLGHGVLPGQGLAARFEIDVARQALQALPVRRDGTLAPLVLVREHRVQQHGEERHQHQHDRPEYPGRPVGPVPVHAQAASPFGHEIHDPAWFPEPYLGSRP
jgi:hypothetical protein